MKHVLIDHWTERPPNLEGPYAILQKKHHLSRDHMFVWPMQQFLKEASVLYDITNCCGTTRLERLTFWAYNM